MTHDVEGLSLNATIEETRNELRPRTERHHGYPVLDDGRLCGIVTRAEIQQAAPDSHLSDLIANQKLFVVDTNCSIRDAANHLISRDFQQVPVVSPTNREKIVGILTLNDISRQQNASDETI
jgi:CIC family chloride channel protein